MIETPIPTPTQHGGDLVWSDTPPDPFPTRPPVVAYRTRSRVFGPHQDPRTSSERTVACEFSGWCLPVPRPQDLCAQISVESVSTRYTGIGGVKGKIRNESIDSLLLLARTQDEPTPQTPLVYYSQPPDVPTGQSFPG